MIILFTKEKYILDRLLQSLSVKSTLGAVGAEPQRLRWTQNCPDYVKLKFFTNA